MNTSYTSKGFDIVQDIIKLKWVPEILAVMSKEKDACNYSKILEQVEYLSNTELNRKLAILLERKAIEKVEFDGRLYYSLLPFGKDLHHIFQHFMDIEKKYAIL